MAASFEEAAKPGLWKDAVGPVEGLSEVFRYENREHIGDDAGEMPPADVDVGGFVDSLAAGDYHTCAMMVDHTLRCWGEVSHGQLGNASYFRNLTSSNWEEQWRDVSTPSYPGGSGVPVNNVGDNPGEMPPWPVPV
eukprot:gene14463-17094_t